MSEWLSHLTPGQMIGLCGVVGGVLIAVVAVASGAWVRVRRTEFLAHQLEAEAVLKQQMIERGMSVEEIERVLGAGTPSKKVRKGTTAEESVA